MKHQKNQSLDFLTWLLGWALVVLIHVGVAYTLARLEGASMSTMVQP